MLNLERKPGETIEIGDDITITIRKIHGDKRVSVGIDAPRNVKVIRGELRATGGTDSGCEDTAKSASDRV